MLSQSVVVAPDGGIHIAKRVVQFPCVRVGLAGQRVERPAVVLHGLFVGIHIARGVAGLKQILDRLRAPVAQPVMVRQQAIVIVEVAGVAAFEILADPAMQLAPARIQHALVGNLLDQRMAKGVHRLGLAALQHGHFMGFQARKLAHERLLIGLLNRVQNAEGDALADHRSHAQHAAAWLVEPVDPREQQAAETIGQLIKEMRDWRLEILLR